MLPDKLGPYVTTESHPLSIEQDENTSVFMSATSGAVPDIVVTMARHMTLFASHVAIEHHQARSRAGLELPPMTFTFQQVNDASDRIARAILDHGAQHPVLLIISSKHPAAYVAMLAALKLGLAFAPIDPYSTPIARQLAVLKQILDNVASPHISAPLVTLMDRENFQAFSNHMSEQRHSALPLNVLILEDLLDSAIQPEQDTFIPFFAKHLDPSSPAYIIFTSGSTGTPKGIVMSRTALSAGIHSLTRLVPRSSQAPNKMIQFSPIHFDVSLLEIFYCFAPSSIHAEQAPCTLVSAPYLSMLQDLTSLFVSASITHACLTPTVATLVDPHRCPSLVFLACSGEAVPDALVQRWIKASHLGYSATELWGGYGPSETFFTSLRPLTASWIDSVPHLSQPKATASKVLGPPLPSCHYAVLHPQTNRPVPIGQVGELWVGGPQRHGSPLLGHINAEGPKVAFLNTESESIEPVNSSRIDHIAIAVEQGTDVRICRVLQRLMAFHRFFCHGEDDNDLEAGLTVEQAETGMRMFTLLSSSDMAKDNMRGSQFGQRNHPSDFYFAIVEPKEGKKGQVYDFVHRHGANIQHVAFKTEDILADVAQIRAQGGLNLIRAGPAAAEHSLALTASFPDAFEQVVRLHQEGILVNARIQDGREKPEVALLSQIFTGPVHPQAELFFELIQRQNYRGFASADIGGLFQAKGETVSSLYVDEILAPLRLRSWVDEKARNGVNVDVVHLKCISEDALGRFLEHITRPFDVFVSSFVPITERILASLPSTSLPKLVQAQGAGFNHIDLAACQQRSIAVANNADWCSKEVAEYCLTAIVNKWTQQSAIDVRNIDWERDPHTLQRHSLSQAHLLIVGYGGIGSHLADLAQSVGVQVHVYDNCRPELCHASLETLLALADFVSIHVPLTRETKDLFGENTIACMKPGSWLINTSRGNIVNEEALLRATKSGKIAGAVLDTPATEERLSNSASDASMLSSRASSPSTALTSASPEGDTRTMRDIFDSVNKKRLEEGIEVFNLSAGMVEVEPCPELLQQAAFAVLSPLCSSKEVPWLHMYRERKGDAVLRQELANLHSSGRYGPRKQNVDAGNVLICSGVSAAIASIFGAWRSNHGSQYRPRIVLFVPYYTYHMEIANGIFGKEGYELVTVQMKIDPQLGCTHDRQATEAILSDERGGADICIITNPHNPSGSVLSEDDAVWFEGLVRTYKRTWFISDEIYADMVYTRRDGVHRSLCVPEADNLFVAYGFSKSLAIGSWRIAYVMLHSESLDMIAKEHDRLYISAPWTQHALGTYLTSNIDAFNRFIAAWHERLSHDAHIIGKALTLAFGWNVIKASGGMYLLVRHDEANDWDAFQVALDKSVAVAPGCLFGLEHGYIRVHLAFSQDQARRVAAKLAP
ncbi:aminotransferase, class I/II superfamily protein [Moesziomyces antarcticus]|uniref:Aminotransferase, class I/II superfamily protein n=1 Tax=Pseudozyma antarctica TaxID=84753 RepID=A0A081CHN5_PSEA2|nr:aminotransferase, class I/II superfamily protein [Moesziomyces antarcticus]GAK66181.1 aminotransferase, class I/II superfamily protein [Moesziomyces antarcticus]